MQIGCLSLTKSIFLYLEETPFFRKHQMSDHICSFSTKQILLMCPINRLEVLLSSSLSQHLELKNYRYFSKPKPYMCLAEPSEDSCKKGSEECFVHRLFKAKRRQCPTGKWGSPCVVYIIQFVPIDKKQIFKCGCGNVSAIFLQLIPMVVEIIKSSPRFTRSEVMFVSFCFFLFNTQMHTHILV